jgi:hypothetical protein
MYEPWAVFFKESHHRLQRLGRRLRSARTSGRVRVCKTVICYEILPMPRSSCAGVISKLSARISIVLKPGSFLPCSNCEI